MFFLFRKQYKHLNRITISRSALIQNHRTLQSTYPNTLICPVLKSNAYGHGLEIVAPIFDSLKPAFLCVDSLYEAYKLQKLGIQSNILILGYTIPENFMVKPLPFHISLFDLETAQVLNKYQKGINVHIKIDTGMSRFGIRLEELRSFLDKIRELTHIKISGVYSHFSSADEAKKDKTNKQVHLFSEAIHVFHQYGIDPQWKHISASAGTLSVYDDVCNMARVGLASYGISPIANNKTNVRPVLEFRSKICQIKQIKKGDTVSYNDTFIAPKNMTIGIIGAGYYEGLDRRLSNIGTVLVKGKVCTILGRVCMNITIVDLSAVKEARVGDECIIFSSNPMHVNSVSKSAHICKTIPYDLLVKLNETIKREGIY